ncbi:Mitochondrial RNA pseudouridine synthase rpusd4 [Merluccius polli]|uniref:Pseudouridylate synthase RPUSD4, mitochondrial n=1 Tax=Merluccius polli TaxID=89951 RepID=A0AA47NRN8_MERPO|nr:Mitochondrial RNA pseudouridine synthase rpusd4 [Merluccius polli]
MMNGCCRAVAVSCCRSWSDVVRNVTAASRRVATLPNHHATSGPARCVSRGLATSPHVHPGPGPEGPERTAPLRAVDLAKKIRREKKDAERAAKVTKTTTTTTATPLEKRVSELKQFTQQLQNVHPNVLAKHLHKTMLFQNKDVVVINKPYGVPVQDQRGGTCISSVLPILVKMMDGAKSHWELQPCLGLEKEVTGTLLLARSQEVVDHIVYLHRHNQLQRKYWAVTVGVPVPSEGVIDIPLIEREVEGTQHHFKMGLSPMFRHNDTGEGVSRIRAHRQADSAVTKYQVLDSRAGCSLVELQPLTGVKHQIRVHLASALGCPILGDHKYSCWSKLAPQLPDNVLGKLGLEKSKTRNLPLHLHARQMILPGNDSQPEIRVSCPMPKYFTKALQRLGLIFPDGKDVK